MCGIAGIINAFKQDEINPENLTQMLGSIEYRGPDQEGFYIHKNIALGHKRLSIIDLNDGNQPMFNQQKNICIVFNGEIYNFKDIRKECEELGYLFKSQSDTEIIIASYELFGIDCLKKFNGMFSFALYDKNKEIVFLARDRLGKKPLYFYKSENVFLFASEIKAIIKHPVFDRKINHEALYDYFLYQYIPDNKTILRGISQVPPGNFMILKNHELETKTYWRARIDIRNSVSKSEYVDKLRYLLWDATKIRMISDVPYGAFLSGGIDSTIITSIMSEISSEKIKTFSLSGGEGSFNELKYANIASKKNNTDHKDFHINDLNLFDLLNDLSSKIDQPFGDSSIIPTFLISKYAKKEVTVALSGEGGDELFGGYDWYRNFLFIRKYWKKIPITIRLFLKKLLINIERPRSYNGIILSIIKKISLANNLSFGSDHEDYRSTSNAFSSGYRDYILNCDFKELVDSASLQENEEKLKKIFESNDADILNKLLLFDLNTYLVSDLLFKVDRMSMLNSLEVRSPLLDYRIVELAFQMPQHFKINSNNTKLILKTAAKNYLPKEIVNRKSKRGFSIPVSDLLRKQLKSFAADEILSDHNYTDGFMNKKNIKNVLNMHFSGKYDYGPQLWSLLMFSLWKKNYFI